MRQGDRGGQWPLPCWPSCLALRHSCQPSPFLEAQAPAPSECTAPPWGWAGSGEDLQKTIIGAGLSGPSGKLPPRV